MSQIIKYLEKRGLQFRRRGEEAVLKTCPFCGDSNSKFAINVVSGLFNCKRANDCGVNGDFYSFQKRLGDMPDKLNKKRVFVTQEKKNYVRPQTDCPPMKDNQVAVYKYLKSRGFSDETIKHFRIGADENNVKFPFFKNGILTNIKYRDINDKKKMRQEKDAEPLLFNRDNIESSILVICEGEYDAMALHQYGIEAVSVPNGASGFTWIEQEWDYLETFRHINICFDNDAAGKEGSAALAARLGLWRCSLINLPNKDANECLMKGVPAEEIIRCFNAPVDLTPETIVSPDYFTDKIQKLFSMGVKLFGTPTAWDDLNSILKGWRGSELTVWSGRNGSGKSTIINQTILDLAAKNEKSCIYSGEMAPERYLRWAVIQHKENDKPSPISISDSLSWMSGKIYVLNISEMISPDKLLEDFEYAARRYDCKHFVIDSLMKVNINENDEYNQQKQFVSRLCDFVKKFNVHVHLVAHPRKTSADTDEPGKVDIKGSSHITDLAHNVIVLYRPNDEQKAKAKKKGNTVSDMQLYVKKNREFGNEGKVHLWFNEQTKKFKESDF
jgi:twinkle protein